MNEFETAILNAGLNCFSNYGFEKTTMDDIGKMVGLNKSSLYYYYKNKDEIYYYVIKKEAEIFTTKLLNKIEKENNYEGKIILYLTERFRFFIDRMNLLNIPLNKSKDIISKCSEVGTLLHDIEMKILTDIIQKGIKEDCFIADLNPEKAAEMLIIFSNGLKFKNIKNNFPLNTQYIDFESLVKDINLYIPDILKGMRK
jgi:AcrR family transcriptional regulator